MHPIERLRHIARAVGADNTLLAREAAGALAAMGFEPSSLITACRRLVEHHAAAGPLWWLCARVLTAPDPRAEAWRCVELLEDDRSAVEAGHDLPDDASVCVVGWPDLLHDAFLRRGDVEVLLVDTEQGPGFGRMLENAGVDVVDVPGAGLGAAVREADVVLLETAALSERSFIATAGSLAAAAVASRAGVPVWLVAGVGRVVPPRVFGEIEQRLHELGDPWLTGVETVGVDLVEAVYDPEGRCDVPEALRRSGHPVAEELFTRAK